MNVCLESCAPKQVISFNIAIDDISKFEIYDTSGNKYDITCLEWSYSIDGVEWSCWVCYNDAAYFLADIKGDYYVKVKVAGPISEIKYNGEPYTDWSASLAKCFEFGPLFNAVNRYNPYANTMYSVGLYNQLSEVVSSIVGIPIYYIKLSPNANTKDVTFKEYALMGVEAIKQIKMVVQDNAMPSSKPEFSEFGFDFSTDWETEITKQTFASAFGITAKPMEGDLVYVPMMKRMWMVNGAYEEKNEGFMWNSATFKISLVKYEDKSSVDLKDAQSFVDSIVKTKYDDLFDEPVSSESYLQTTKAGYQYLYPVYESDALRKYVKNTETTESGTIESLNTKLISYQKWHKGIMVCDKAYDWTNVTDESFIIYQNKISGNDITFSFIFEPSGDCKGKLFDIGAVALYIECVGNTVKLTIGNILTLEIENNACWFVTGRWNKKLNICELSASKYTYNQNIPIYKVQPHSYYFDIDNKISVVSKYDIELEQCEKHDVITYSFKGKITNIKLYESYIDNDSELLQMYPENTSIIINDTARKFISLPGYKI